MCVYVFVQVHDSASVCFSIKRKAQRFYTPSNALEAVL